MVASLVLLEFFKFQPSAVYNKVFSLHREKLCKTGQENNKASSITFKYNQHGSFRK